MSDRFDLADFLEPVDNSPLPSRDGYREGQLGKYVDAFEGELPSIEDADLVIVGCGESRGDAGGVFDHAAPNAVRRQLYALYHWHSHIRVADLGNIREGSSTSDSHAALRTVVSEACGSGRKVVILGGSHDLTMAQYEVYRSKNRFVEATVVDAYIDLAIDLPVKSRNFLMEMLTGDPNCIRHYNHIAFQSYLVHPNMLETMDKLRFDCHRLGRVRESIEEMEPAIRNSHMLSFDLAALQQAYAPGSASLPNGLTGEEACILTGYCGSSETLDTFGIYGYDPSGDPQGIAARQAAQMVWYFMDGMRKGMAESTFDDPAGFIEYHTAFAEVETVFLQSRRTGRWWMRMPDGGRIACTQGDYLQASNDEIPERWLRAQERL
jgi:arginase family enzyme